VTDTVWNREMLHRLCRQYPRVPALEIETMLALCWRMREPGNDNRGAMHADVEAQMCEALHALTHPVPRQRSARESVRARLTAH
jgi:hypothetical protein